MRILMAQCASVVGDMNRNLSKLESVFSKTDAELTIFPEMFLSGYLPRDNLSSLAEPIDGPTVGRLVDLCRRAGKGLMTGIPLRHATIKGQITNSVVAIDEKGKVGRYDKTYLPTFGPFEESIFFTPGGAPLAMEMSPA